MTPGKQDHISFSEHILRTQLEPGPALNPPCANSEGLPENEGILRIYIGYAHVKGNNKDTIKSDDSQSGYTQFMLLASVWIWRRHYSLCKFLLLVSVFCWLCILHNYT